MNTNPDSIPPEDVSAKTVAAADLVSLEAELARQKDVCLRLGADFENFRKRTTQETERRAAAQKEAFIRELLPVIDNLERALASSNISTSHEHLRQGVRMTLQQLKQLLRSQGIEAEESVGQLFDPNRHEALRTGYDASQPDQVILETFQRGYRRGNQIFRPAQVVVNDLSQSPSEADEETIPVGEKHSRAGGKRCRHEPQR